ncbi:fasciclin domain-containing protein [Croceitalea marina]|uniref:Fasciclin domain-containing protein n=1 Tax=Croceitalea marina TaxID=1775166 RepID=A0ABW5MUB6_9FLAO
MKQLTNFFKISLVLSVFVIASCSDDDNGGGTDMETTTIVDLAVATNDLSILVDALTSANLAGTLEGDGPFTVFAPTNSAFEAFLEANDFASLEDVPNDVLTQVLLNHVVSGENLSSSLSTGYISSLSTAGAEGRNLSLYINISTGVTINGVADVVTEDIQADNGVVHIVDAVIGLPTIVDHAVSNSELSSLVTALTADNNTTFTTLLSSTITDFTVFAPVNAAFGVYTNPNSNDINDVLSYHVISGDAAFSDELMNMYVSTAATNADGDALSQYINTDDGVSINASSNVAIADIVAVNGVVHAVDAVIDLPSVVTFAAADPNFSTLVQALTDLTPSVNFVEVLSAQDGNGNDPFTVFAPTNDAFAALSAIPAEEDLIPILQHHVVAGANIRSSDLTADGTTTTPATLEGDTFTITLPGTDGNIADVTDGAGNDGIGIIAVDVQAKNGVIHVLNTVLIPDTTN